MSKKAKMKKAVKKETVPGARFEGTKKLLAQYKVPLKKVTSKLVCNFGDCKKKLPIQGELNGQPISRHRWCKEHKLLTDKVRNYHNSLQTRGYSPKKLPPNRYDVRGGKVTLFAQLQGVDPEKALAKYKQGRKGRKWFGLESAGKKRAEAAKKVGKKLAKAAKKVVKAVKRPTPKKVPAPKVGLKAMLNGKGTEAAVAAHIAAKKAAEAKH